MQLRAARQPWRLRTPTKLDHRAMNLQTDRLFTYGTLMPGSGHPMALRLKAECIVLGAASVCGLLYDLGDYPGLVPSQDAGRRVHGMLLRLRDPRSSLRWLDAYEGCGKDDAEPHAYERVIASVRLEPVAGRGLPTETNARQGAPAMIDDRSEYTQAAASAAEMSAWIYYYRWPPGDALLIESGRYWPRAAHDGVAFLSNAGDAP
jgi:gamma-glutamylcyclotransferase (GGCT)/AIG2-like uncharacterized protein YtfP